jgi:hypothetical protein
MDIVQIEEKLIRGISVRTKNTDERSPATAKIGLFHKRRYISQKNVHD